MECNTLLWNHTCYDFRFFQNFQDKPRNVSGVFMEQTTDRQVDLLFWDLRYTAHCTSLELLSYPLQNKTCYRLHPKYKSFFCFLIFCSSPVWKSLFLRNRSYLRHFWYLEGSWLNVISSFCRQLLLSADYSLVHFKEITSLDVSKKS